MKRLNKPENIVKTLRRILSYFKPFKISVLGIVFSAFISGVSTIFGPKILGEMVDTISQNFVVIDRKIHFNPDMNSIMRSGFILIGIYVISGLFGYIQNFIMAGIAQKITFKMREQLSRKIAKLPISYVDNRKTGDIVSIITNDIETLSSSFSQTFSTIINSIIVLIGVSTMMILISWQISLIALFSAVISIVIVRAMAGFSQVYFRERQKNIGRINAHAEEVMSSHEIVKVYNGESDSIAKFKEINNDMYKTAWLSQFFGGLTYPLTYFIGNFSVLMTAIVGGFKVISGQITLGDVSSLMSYAGQFNRPISEVASSMTVIQSTFAASERVFDFLDADEELNNKKYRKLPKKILGEVEFSKVNFSYDDDKLVIKNFSMRIPANSTVAIVGPTGSGKTTLVNLLMRFYDVNSGKIKIDNIDISQISRNDVRSLFGMVLQDTWLFSGTIAENISYSKPKATRKEVVNAAKLAHADHFIRTLPKGYDTIISDDVDNISAGEKQLITIARAILADSSMLILDEATSSVDTKTELAIQSAMNNLVHGRTSFVIAHRLSTIKNADIILMIKDGNVVEQGSHDSLLAQNGEYAKLYNSQFFE